MKPDWDKLIGEFEGSDIALVADVDCTANGKSLCDSVGVKGYPTLKWGDPSNLEDYEGGRDYSSLLKFAKENLKPVCSPSNIDLCDDEKKAEIERIQAMSDEDLASAIGKGEEKLEEAEATFKKEVEKLQDQYQKLMKAKDDAQAAVKASGLGLMKSVQASKKRADVTDEL